MTPTKTHSLRVTRTIRATPERLFDAWTDPEALATWWRMAGDGWAFSGARLDLRVGGRYRVGMTDPAGTDHVAVGEYREIQRPTRLVFTWDWQDAGSRVGETLVTVEFRPAGKGATEVVLTHERFANDRAVRGHEQGWTQLLRLLEHATA
jgi:uncharacterized protein YndB with AHSA1/START domain